MQYRRHWRYESSMCIMESMLNGCSFSFNGGYVLEFSCYNFIVHATLHMLNASNPTSITPPNIPLTTYIGFITRTVNFDVQRGIQSVRQIS